MIGKILVAIDGSTEADRALDFALNLAQKYSAEVTLLTVVPSVFLPVPSLNVINSEAIADASAELEKGFNVVMSRAKKKAKRISSIEVFTELKHAYLKEKVSGI